MPTQAQVRSFRHVVVNYHIKPDSAHWRKLVAAARRFVVNHDARLDVHIDLCEISDIDLVKELDTMVRDELERLWKAAKQRALATRQVDLYWPNATLKPTYIVGVGRLET